MLGALVCDALHELTHFTRRNSHKNMTFAKCLIQFQPLEELSFKTFPGEHAPEPPTL